MTKKKHTWRKLIQSNILLPVFFSFILLSPAAYGKGKTYQLSSNYNFPEVTENKISDESGSLNAFFLHLDGLEEKKDSSQVVSILHIGDSHIQADFETDITRKLFQQHFGSAGRGLVAPLKLAKTNEPRNYRISSNQVWDSFRCIKTNDIPVGLAGLTLQRKDSISDIRVETLNKIDPDFWNFNEVTVFYDQEKAKVLPSDTSIITGEEDISPYAHKFTLNSPVNYLNLNFNSDQNDICFYGIELKNGQNGVLYHAVGINGARYDNYANEALFFKQMSDLNPYLIIISLGTNEAYHRSFNSEAFYNTIDLTVKNIRQTLPNAGILLTTPAETWLNYRKKSRTPNSRIKTVSNTIVKYAKDNQLACWDLFSITGGENSARYWRQNGLLSGDGVHFSKGGYEYIGELLFQAIYNSYVRH